jgi:hypothetical protein
MPYVRSEDLERLSTVIDAIVNIASPDVQKLANMAKEIVDKYKD